MPLADSGLSGLILGLGMQTTGAHVYRALMEAICYGARSVADLFAAGELAADRVILTSGLARRNPLLVQIMADVLGREVEVPEIEHATAVGAAIHGAVAAGIVDGYEEGAARFGAHTATRVGPQPRSVAVYEELYAHYAALAGSDAVRQAMHGLNRIAAQASAAGSRGPTCT